jgi:hypothetical protein
MWIHNGRRDEGAEWRLLVLQPLWTSRSSDGPQIPVPVRTVDTARLVIRQTFLNLESIDDDAPCIRRAQSLDARLRL